jgi:hypothetical protein
MAGREDCYAEDNDDQAQNSEARDQEADDCRRQA